MKRACRDRPLPRTCLNTAVATHAKAKPPVERRQRRRVPPMMLASGGAYVANVSLFGACAALGMLRPMRIAEYVGMVALWLALLFASAAWAPKLLGSGARSTFGQLLFAMFPGLYVAAAMGDSIGRIAFAMLVSGALVWGVLWLNARLFLLLTLSYAGGYLLLVDFLHWRQAGSIDLVAECVIGASLLACGVSIAALGAYVSSVRSRLVQRSAELRETMASIELQTIRDELTGLANRRCVLQTLREAAGPAPTAGRVAGPLSVVVFDLDHFKRINDLHGHAAGDEVLRRVSSRLSLLLQPGHTLGRLGGEELLLLLPLTDAAAALREADRLRREVAAIDFADVAQGLRVTMSCGVASAVRASAHAAIDVDGLLQRADHAMYRAKSLGRDRVHAAEHAGG